MTSPLAARLSRFLIRCYPPRWRQRYAEELLEVLDQHQPTARTVLSLWAGAVSAHLDPAWRAGRHPLIRLRRWAPVVSGTAGTLLSCCCPPGSLPAYAFWSEKYGAPMPLSGGVFGMAFSPDGRTVAVINPSLELWDVADRAHPKRLGYSEGDDIVSGDGPGVLAGRARPGHRRRADRDLVERGRPDAAAHRDRGPAALIRAE